MQCPVNSLRKMLIELELLVPPVGWSWGIWGVQLPPLLSSWCSRFFKIDEKIGEEGGSTISSEN